ncbi:hypothetical protein [Streptomyces sp. CS090A]|nr:hypothetical protein [Streptomyces sp. CS090A]
MKVFAYGLPESVVDEVTEQAAKLTARHDVVGQGLGKLLWKAAMH